MRIISLVPSHTEILFYLGLGENVVGVTENCDFPLEALDKERTGYFSRPNISKIISLKPDLVVAGGRIHREHVERLKLAGINVFAFEPVSVAALLDGMEELLQITEAQANISRIDVLATKKNRIEELGNLHAHQPGLAFVIGHDALAAPSPVSCQYDALKLCGVQPMPVAGDVALSRVAWEDIASFNPEIILACGRRSFEQPRRRCAGCAIDNRPCARDIEIVKQNPILRNVAAVKSNQVYPVPCHLFCRPGPRLFEGMEWLVKLLLVNLNK